MRQEKTRNNTIEIRYNIIKIYECNMKQHNGDDIQHNEYI